MLILNEIGKRLKALRKMLKLTQNEMAKILNTTIQTILRYEKGRVMPSLKFLSNLANIYNINANWLLTGKGEIFLSRLKIIDGKKKHAILYKIGNKNYTDRDIINEIDIYLKNNPEYAVSILKIIHKKQETDKAIDDFTNK